MKTTILTGVLALSLAAASAPRAQAWGWDCTGSHFPIGVRLPCPLGAWLGCCNCAPCPPPWSFGPPVCFPLQYDPALFGLGGAHAGHVPAVYATGLPTTTADTNTAPPAATDPVPGGYPWAVPGQNAGYGNYGYGGYGSQQAPSYGAHY